MFRQAFEMKIIRDKQLFSTICPKLIKDSSELVTNFAVTIERYLTLLGSKRRIITIDQKQILRIHKSHQRRRFGIEI